MRRRGLARAPGVPGHHGIRRLRALSARLEALRLSWKAYPILRPAPKWPPFVLHPGLYYVNAMESAVSTMETEIIASRNVVTLLANDLR